MNKAELVKSIVEKTSLTQKDVTKVIEAFTDAVATSLKKGEKVSLMGFGSWDVKKRNARTGRNPQTGKAIKIKAKNVAKFRPGKELETAASKAKIK